MNAAHARHVLFSGPATSARRAGDLLHRDHGVAANVLEDGLDKATEALDRLKAAGIDIDQITQQLEDEGIDKFNKPFEKLLKSIEDQKAKV